LAALPIPGEKHSHDSYGRQADTNLRARARVPRSPGAPPQRGGGPIEEIRPDVVICFPPGEKYWHGATTTTAMMQLAIQEQLNGKAVDRMEGPATRNTRPDDRASQENVRRSNAEAQARN
jgi:hypothetical protein